MENTGGGILAGGGFFSDPELGFCASRAGEAQGYGVVDMSQGKGHRTRGGGGGAGGGGAARHETNIYTGNHPGHRGNPRGICLFTKKDAFHFYHMIISASSHNTGACIMTVAAVMAYPSPPTPVK